MRMEQSAFDYPGALIGAQRGDATRRDAMAITAKTYVNLCPDRRNCEYVFDSEKRFEVFPARPGQTAIRSVSPLGVAACAGDGGSSLWLHH